MSVLPPNPYSLLPILIYPTGKPNTLAWDSLHINILNPSDVLTKLLDWVLHGKHCRCTVGHSGSSNKFITITFQSYYNIQGCAVILGLN